MYNDFIISYFTHSIDLRKIIDARTNLEVPCIATYGDTGKHIFFTNDAGNFDIPLIKMEIIKLLLYFQIRL